MPDMLVNLMRLPPAAPALDALNAGGVFVRRARPWEAGQLREFVTSNFGRGWADEMTVRLVRQPVTVFVALREGLPVGFAAYECTRKNFFGPRGVVEGGRGRGVGRALLLASLWGLRELGYAYAVVGGVGPAEFCERAVGARLIPDSSPGVCANPIRDERDGGR